MAALVAPAPAADRQHRQRWHFPLDGVVRTFAKARGIYRLTGRPRRSGCRSQRDRTGHAGIAGPRLPLVQPAPEGRGLALQNRPRGCSSLNLARFPGVARGPEEHPNPGDVCRGLPRPQFLPAKPSGGTCGSVRKLLTEDVRGLAAAAGIAELKPVFSAEGQGCDSRRSTSPARGRFACGFTSCPSRSEEERSSASGRCWTMPAGRVFWGLCGAALNRSAGERSPLPTRRHGSRQELLTHEAVAGLSRSEGRRTDGLGPSDGKQTQHRRRFYFLGQTSTACACGTSGGPSR